MKTDDYTEGLAAAWGGQPQGFAGKSAEYYEGYLVGWDLRRLPAKVSEEKLAQRVTPLRSPWFPY